MFTIIGADGKEYGPVTADKLREWIASGRANAQTQCRREGEVAWSTLGSLPEFASGFAATPPPTAFAAGPAASPAGSSSALPATPPDPKAFADAVIASGARVNVFDCLGAGLRTWTSHFLPLVGVTALVWIITFVVGMIPLVGFLSQLLLTGAFYAGLHYYYLGKIRGEPREIGDAFAGFSRGLGALILCNLMQSVVLIGITVLFMAPLVGAFIPLLFSRGGAEEFVLPALAPVALGAITLGGLLVIFVSVSLIFAFTLIIDKGLDAWGAIVVSWRVVIRNWFSVFFVVLLAGLLTGLGLIVVFIGLLLTLPIFFASLMHAYESLFGRTAATPALPH